MKSLKNKEVFGRREAEPDENLSYCCSSLHSSNVDPF